MRLPINTSAMQFMGATAPEVVLDYETKAPKTDDHGEILHAVQVVALAEGSVDIVKVVVAGQPRVDQGMMLRVDDLVASPWSMGDRSGVAYRASKIEALAGAAPSTGRKDG